MTADIINLADARLDPKGKLLDYFLSDACPLSFSAEHCATARGMLGWSVEALAFRSGVSPKAIRELESGSRSLRRVSMQALAFAFESEALVFFPKLPPMIGDNCRGSTPDPKGRPDFHLIE